MADEPILAGIYDPRQQLAPERARELVRSALSFHGTPRLVQSGPLTAGVAPASGDDEQAGTAQICCLLDGRLKLASAPAQPAPWASEAAIARAWAADGDEALISARGSFVVVLWDEERQRGVVARDHVGERALVWHAAGHLAFASDFRPLLGLLSHTPGPDDTAVACWLGASIPAEGRTFFQGVRRVLPGHLLELAEGSWSPRPYWVPRYREPFEGTPDELHGGLRQQLDRATAATLDGLGAPGVLLSGGLDSSTVAALAAPRLRETGGSLRAYSAVFPDLPTADESPFIDQLLSAYGISGTRMAVQGGSLLAGALAYLRASRMPDISANNFFWIDLLKQAASEGADVLLDGSGGDEVFTTPYFLPADLLRAGRIRETLALIERWPGITRHPGRRVRVKLFAQYGLAGVVPHAVHRAWPRLRSHPLPLELTDAAARLTRKSADTWAWKSLDGPRWWAKLADTIVYGAEGIGGEHGMRIARMAGVERRRPLRDLDLVEHVLRLPPEIAFEPSFTRWHQRAAMAGIVPDTVRLRRQKSFFTDVRVRSLAGWDLPIARRLLGADAEVRRFVRPEPIEETLKGLPRGASLADRGLWGFRLQHLAVTELWLRAQADPGFIDAWFPDGTLEPARFELQPQGEMA